MKKKEFNKALALKRSMISNLYLVNGGKILNPNPKPEDPDTTGGVVLQLPTMSPLIEPDTLSSCFLC